MNGFVIAVLVIIGFALVWIMGYLVVSKQRKAISEKKYQGCDVKHKQNMLQLQSSGFHIEESSHYRGYKVKDDEYIESTVYLYYDYAGKKAALEYYDREYDCSPITIFPLNKIVDCELLQDYTSVSKEEGTFGGASAFGYGGISGNRKAVSQVMAGGLAVRLTIDDIRVSSIVISIIEGSTEKASDEYQGFLSEAQQIYGKFQSIVLINNAECQKREQQAVQEPKTNEHEKAIEQIRQLAKLKDEGILSEEEFEAKKKLLMEKIR